MDENDTSAATDAGTPVDTEAAPSAPGAPKPPTSADVGALIEKAFMMGIGFAEITRDKLGAFSNELAERGKMSDSEAKHVVDRVSDRASEQGRSLREMVEEETEHAMKAAGVATRADLDELHGELTEIKAMLARLGTPGATNDTP